MAIKSKLRFLLSVIILILLSTGCTTLNGTKDKNIAPSVVDSVPPVTDNTTKPEETNTSSPVALDTNKETSSIDENYIFPDSQVKKLDEIVVVSLKPALLPFARNEIFARRGYVFTNKVYKDYFENKPWYKPDPNFNQNGLSDIEKYNIDLIRRLEDHLYNNNPKTSFQVMAYKANTEISFDLNGDGIKENIIYKPVNEELVINNKTITFHFDNPVEYFAIVDINLKDKFKEVLISDYGPSDDYRTFYYYFDGTNIVKMGETRGLFNSGISIDGAGKITALSRGSILQTWFFNKSFKLSVQHKLEEIFQDLYLTNCHVSLNMQLMLYKNKGDNTPSIVVNKGEKLKIIGTDDKEWCLLKTTTGTLGWIAVDKFSTIRNNGLQASEVFEGLNYAD